MSLHRSSSTCSLGVLSTSPRSRSCGPKFGTPLNASVNRDRNITRNASSGESASVNSWGGSFLRFFGWGDGLRTGALSLILVWTRAAFLGRFALRLILTGRSSSLDGGDDNGESESDIVMMVSAEDRIGGGVVGFCVEVCSCW